MKFVTGHRLKIVFCSIALLGLSACSDSSSSSPDEGAGNGGIIGTGIILDGTTTSNKLYASNTVEARARSGELSTAAFGAQGRFQFDDLAGAGPWLIRTDLGNGTYLYGVASDTASETSSDSLVQNVHSYSDAAVRSFYSTRNLDIDAVFASEGALSSVPTRAELQAISGTLVSIVGDVLEQYGLSGVNLDTDEFVADGTGIDQFILQNPVINNDNSITIIIFDPENETASVAVEDLSLRTSLTDADNTAPTAPANLRALPSASDEITLVWDVASDNIGIVRYAILRDGLEIATSPYPVFIDGGLTANTQFSYTIVAFDAAGNASSESLQASASPLAAVDTIAPPTPSSVLIDTRRGSLDLTWTQTGISDVASFAIRRGTSPTDLPIYVNVNSTFVFDEAVDAGVQYCYVISAVDASGNESTPTGVVCATAPGTVVSGGGSTTQTPVNVPTGDGLTAPQVDVSSITCTTPVPERIIQTAVTFSAGCYLAPNGISVSEPGVLTLEPGVVIKFDSRDRLTVGDGASIIARGTAANPIVLTGSQAFAGHWRGVFINASRSPNNVLDHVQVEYAGSTADEGGIALRSTRVAISNTTSRFNAGAGLSMTSGVELSSLDGNRFTGNAVPVQTHAESVFLLDQRSEYTGNTLDAIVVTDSDIDIETTWAGRTVPYHSDGLDILADGELTVEAGATILFEEDTLIQVNRNGTLRMLGTAEAPISLSGLNGMRGGWGGLYFSQTENDNLLQHVFVTLAGPSNRRNGSIATFANSASTRISFDNVTISDGVGFGIDADDGSVFPVFNNVTITGNDALARLGIYNAEAFNNTGNFTGNTEDTIVLERESIDRGDVVLSNADVPYIAETIFLGNDSGLTLEAGVTLLMEEDATFILNSGNTSLTTNGTAIAPVSIIGREPVPGFWNGIVFSRSGSTLNRLTNTLIADGGDAGDDEDANVKFICSNSSPGTLLVENSRFENSAGFGLFVSAQGCTVDIDAGTTFTNNALGETN